MAVKICNVAKKSVCHRKGLRDGDILVSINGNEIVDVLDYRFYATDTPLSLTYTNAKGKTKTCKVRTDGDPDSLGLSFETYLMDKHHACKNKCVFCFIDQMPKGMRDSLYFKDDDSRLSFLFGNYITLTGLTENEVQRIIKMHISPINVSVHTMNPELRVQMMKNPNAGTSLSYLKRFAEAGISVNTQLVLCPGINDGEELTSSLEKLGELFPGVQSIAAVPVGLTRYRDDLPVIEAYTKETAKDVIARIDAFNDAFEKQNGHRIAYAADEFFLKAELPLPPPSYYGDYCQLDNGVGMLTLLEDEFTDALQHSDKLPDETPKREICLATGTAAYAYIHKLCGMFMQKFPSLQIQVCEIRNKFFGESVTVAGLITGQDLIACLREAGVKADKVLIPNVMLRSKQDPVFLDDYSIADIEAAINREVVAIDCDGAALFDALYSETGG